MVGVDVRDDEVVYAVDALPVEVLEDVLAVVGEVPGVDEHRLVVWATSRVATDWPTLMKWTSNVPFAAAGEGASGVVVSVAVD